MAQNGIKITEFIDLFELEILNKGNDFNSARLTITDANRPGLLRLL